MKFNLDSYRQLVKTIINLSDSPKKLAISFSAGVFISVSPFFGIHTILIIALSFLFRLNKLSAIAGSWVNMPWTVPFVYYGEYKIGALLLHENPGFSLQPFTLEHYIRNGSDAFLAIFAGSIIVGILLSIIFYFLLKYTIEYYRRKKNAAPKR